ncbi:MAG: trypsin-like peptidase domain-containing protein [Candidatus Bathyarchaeota archaeon]|nr:MAG: trypsin-like peptidase domain-containing protein [Candidatus Bathyarchaeota archaeon]
MHKSNTYLKASASLLVLLFAAGLLVGGLFTFYITFQEITNLSNEVASLKSQVSELNGTQNLTYQNITIFQDATALADIYADVRDSVVLVQGTTNDGGVQGSGFVYAFSDRNVVITNYHVVHDTSSLSVTFSTGNGFSATILGTDSYADLAILSVDAPAREFKPVEIVSSSTLRVGDPVIAIGNPYGLVGSLTTGVVSALGRTLTEEDYAGACAIANIIPTSAPINPGNSGGPLLNAVGKVVGVTTAIVSDSQGLGFAIPSNTILREISALITTGTYRNHSYLGVTGQDMSYNIAQQIGVSVTYGWRIASVIAGSPSDGRLNVNDIIIAMNETQIRNNDDLATYLAEKTLPGQLLILTVVRDDATIDVNVILGTRPAPPT